MYFDKYLIFSVFLEANIKEIILLMWKINQTNINLRLKMANFQMKFTLTAGTEAVGQTGSEC